MPNKSNYRIFFLTTLFLLSSSILYAQSVDIKLARVLMYQKKYTEALGLYKRHLAANPKDASALIEAGDISFWTKDYDGALGFYRAAATNPSFLKIANDKIAEVSFARGDLDETLKALEQVLATNPSNNSARIRTAQILSWQGQYDKSIALYNKALQADPNNVQALEGLAEVLSWTKQYDESVAQYDKLLSVKFDEKYARQKARVLGWAKKYAAALAAYDEAYEKTSIENVKLERDAKRAFWNKRVYGSLKKYRSLLVSEPENVEAHFDYAQVEGYQGMYSSALADFAQITNLQPKHFRASDGAQLAQIYKKAIAFTPQFSWFRARSDDRSTHIDRFTLSGYADFPIIQQFSIIAGYAFDYFKFHNAGSIPRQQATIGARVNFGPYLWANATYSPTLYTSDSRTSQLFEGRLTARPFDPVLITAFTKRDDLYNQRIVFDKKLHSTDVGGMVQADIHRRLTTYADYRYSLINDGNRANFAGFENLVFLLYEPKRLSVDARIEYWNYNQSVPDYFSPQNYVSGALTIHWRHYLNKNGMYFGTRNTYYGIKYRFLYDSTRSAFNGGTFEFNHDFTQRYSLKAEVFGTYGTVYNDTGALIGFIGRF